MKKTCNKCGIEKDVSEFHKSKNCKYGVNGTCKVCRSIHYKIINGTNEKQQKRKAYYLKNKEKLNQVRKEYRLKNKKKLKEKAKEYYSKNSERIKKIAREYSSNNREKRNKYIKYKMINDTNFMLKYRLRWRVNSVIKRGSKSATTLTLLGTSIEKFKAHLENQFLEGMNWDNYGLYGWHIDHIKPCASFDLTDPEQQKECFHYTNLQPLWAKDNLEKSDKISYEYNNIL